MRIQTITITRWRHFENIHLDLPDDAPVICLVGENGTGKTQILELIAACASRIGLASGNESARGDPFVEGATFSVRFYIAPGAVPPVDTPTGHLQSQAEIYSQWDRTITLKCHQNSVTISAGGFQHPQDTVFASAIVQSIAQSEVVHYLSLDADRAYPKIQIPTHELGQAFERDWDATLKQSSFRITRNLYDEWFRFLIGKENQDNNKFVRSIRLARDAKIPDPLFVDQFEGYKDAIRKVLPHLLFVGIDSHKREIMFDSTGTPLSFYQLSGGEREIAFLIGQIERFSLRKGLLLVDEPELHLNYDLLRSWIGFLKGSVEQGQIWLATHSLEVVEVTGQDATFLLQRDHGTRHVNAASSLNSQPVVASLSRAVGSPAFSIGNLAFVLVEGDEEIGERERFRLMTGVKQNVRFMEAGTCNDVVRRMGTLRALTTASDQSLRLGGVIDGDWRTEDDCRALQAQGLFVLPVHEIENFLLHPATLEELLRGIGRENPERAATLVLDAADRRAGAWILEGARTNKVFMHFPPPSKQIRGLAHHLSWNDFDDLEARCRELAAADHGLDAQQSEQLAEHLIARAKIYFRHRERDVWRNCEGKEVFRSVARSLGFADVDTAERAIIAVWIRRPDLMPEGLVALRSYVGEL